MQDRINSLPIAIWGCNEFSFTMSEYIKQSELKIICYIDDNPTKTSHNNKSIYTPSEFKSNEDYQTLPIIVALPHQMKNGIPAIDFECIYQFKLKLQQLQKNYQIENHLLHPAAIADFVTADFRNKTILFGLPGSGITLLTQICLKLKEVYPGYFITKNKTALFLEQLSREYTQCIHQIIPDLAHTHGGYNFQMVPWKLGTNYAVWTKEQSKIELYTFNTRNHLIGPVYGYHQMPSHNLIRNLKEQKYHLFFNMRNPLDAILSKINKTHGINKQTGEIDWAVFKMVSLWVINMLKHWYPISPHLKWFTYETLVENPEHTIKELMRYYRLPIRKSVIKNIWQSLSFKLLPSLPHGHFWIGGQGKWQEYFKKNHLEFLKAAGIEEVMELYNYPHALQQFKNKLNECSSDNSTFKHSGVTYATIQPPGDETTDTHHFLHNLNGEKNYVACKTGCIVGPENLHNKIKEHYERNFVRKLVFAGAHSTKRFL